LVENKRGSISMLSIKDLHCSIKEKEILRGINLQVNPGEIHVVMGPNGSGKSTLSQVLTGHPDYQVTRGEILFKQKQLLELEPYERAREGIFMAFQYPVEIPGVSNTHFLKAALNAIRTHRNLPTLDAMDFEKLVKEKMDLIDMDSDMLGRSVNQGFSGGEKKKNEILQLLLLEPDLAILDETDSGLDIDALNLISKGVDTYSNESNAIIIVTHYQRLLQHMKVDHIHVLVDGVIVKSSGQELVKILEEKGYDWLKEKTVKLTGTDE